MTSLASKLPIPARPTSVVEQIKEMIVLNRLSPGDPLPTEHELSSQLGVSRSRVREAVKTLAALDIVEVRHGYGTYVGQMTMTALVESLAFRGMLLGTQGDNRVIEELIDLRQLLETSLAELVITRMTPQAALGLRRCADSMRDSARRGVDLASDDRAFHLLLTETTGNALAVQLTGAFWDIYALAAVRIGPSRNLEETAEAHSVIVDAIEAGDPAALRSAIVRHYDPIRDRLAGRPVGSRGESASA